MYDCNEPEVSACLCGTDLKKQHSGNASADMADSGFSQETLERPNSFQDLSTEDAQQVEWFRRYIQGLATFSLVVPLLRRQDAIEHTKAILCRCGFAASVVASLHLASLSASIG